MRIAIWLLSIFFFTSIFVSLANAVLCSDGFEVGGVNCTVACGINITVYAKNTTASEALAWTHTYNGTCSDSNAFNVSFSKTLNNTAFICGYYYAGVNESDYGTTNSTYLFEIIQ